ncbi:ATP-binding protein [Nocardioides pelophilus]|uniref:ATP-binding protein n=1 Tax=Nocardioides pelophilus TaxID=2172019 RepID=UPI0016047754|nr:adenylate/guanylate cyclase domain-containing protein [Nocardioides pelophilus]
MVVELPSGVVTFAFVDVVGSTLAFAEHGDAFVTALERLHAEIADATSAHGGVVVKTEGDGAFLAFGDEDGALRALIQIQARVEAAAADTTLPEPRLRVRAGAHAGRAQPVGGDYIALPVNVAARVTSAAGAGQALVTPAVVDGLTDRDLVRAAGDPVGEYALKDVRGPTPLHRVAGGPEPPRAAPYRRTNVAEPITSFVGRDRELAELGELVASHRLVTVLGPGGMGKTRLTSQLLLQVAGSYDGAWLVELASVSDPARVVGQVAAGLGSRATTTDELVAELAVRGPTLVLLDNCEHLIDAAADVAAELLARLAGLRIVATSREPLQVEGEVVWRIPALVGDDARCALFAHRYTSASGGGFDSLDRSMVAELCSTLDGSPLAIELAAVHAREVPLRQLIDLLLDGSETLARRGGGRQSSLDAVVAWSMDRLDVAHREALLVLSQAPARLTADEAGLLLRDVAARRGVTPPALLRGLVRVSLVDLDGDRYRLLDTIRAAARRALHADQDLLPRARAMLHAAAAALADADKEFSMVRTGDPRADRVLLLEEAVLDAWSDRTPGLGQVWTDLGTVAVYLPTSQRLHTAALEVLQETPTTPEIGADDAGRVTGALDIVESRDRALTPWSPDDALRFLDAVVAGSPAAVAAWTAGRITAFFWLRDRIAEAHSVVTSASRLAEESGSALHRVNAATNEGLLAHTMGDDEAALRHADRALEIAPDDFIDIAVLVNNRACSLNALGRHEEALQILRDALDRHPVARNRWALTESLVEVLRDSGAREDALAVARQCYAELALEPAPGPASDAMAWLLPVLRGLEA